MRQLRHVYPKFLKNWVDVRNSVLLYKYLPLRNDNQEDLSRIRSVIDENMLYFSCLKDFNDPFDCSPIYGSPREDFEYYFKRLSESNKYSIDELNRMRTNWKQGDRETQEKLIDKVNSKMWIYINEELGICCFSGKPDSLLMWAHYASCHTGVCFEFNRTPNAAFFGEVLKVRYKPYRPKVNMFKQSQDATVNIFLTKSSDWKYETEYRIIGPHRKPGQTHQFPKEYLKGIILGAKIKKENEATLRNIIEGHYSIAIKKAKLDDCKYKIVIET